MRTINELRFALLASSALCQLGFAQDTIFTIDGDFALNQVGGCGDLNGDGHDDFIVGESAFGFGGRVKVCSGVDGAILHEFNGVLVCNSSETLGFAVDGAGDFDGDGIGDLTIGSPGYADPLQCTLPGIGKVSVFSGSTWQILFEGYGTEAQDYFGRRVRGLGDVNGDGFDDVGAAGQAGYVRIYLGPSGALLREHAGPGLWPSIDGVGDMDRDGFDDYAIGWMQDSTIATYTGKVVVHSGRTAAPIQTVYGVNGYGGGFSGDHLGRSVAGVGDVNGDGIPDFAAGAPGEFDIGWGLARGYFRVYSGLDASILLHIEGDRSVSMLGFGVAGGGDLNGDGTPDLLAGAPYDTDTGIAKGSVAAYSGRTGTMLWKVYAEENWARIGDDRSLAIVGDVNLDGLGDWAVGDWSVGSSDDGRVTVFSGFAGDGVRICTSTPNSTGVAAVIATLGAISIGDEELALEVSGGVPNQFGLFFYGPTEVEIPFGNGWRCAGGQLFRFTPPMKMDGAGALSRAIDFDAPPVGSGAGQWTAGSTWVTQFWYRDPMGGGAFFNLSDALAVTFTP